MERATDLGQYWVMVCNRRRLYEIDRDGRAHDITNTVSSSGGTAAPRSERQHLDARQRADLQAARSARLRCAEPRRCVTAGAASFVADELRECVDVEASGLSVPDDSARSIMTLELIETHRPCETQFANRQPLARCNVVSTTSGVELRVSRRFYRYEDAVASDAEAQRCLTAHGEWVVESTASPLYREAQAAFEARALQAEAARRAQEAAPVPTPIAPPSSP